MNKLFGTLLIFGIIGCRSRSATEEVHELAKWKGRNEKELLRHSYFKTLPKKKNTYEDGTITFIFTNQSNFQTGAYCQSLGGCIGMPAYNCQHVVSLKSGFIFNLSQTGTCPDSKTTAP